jgi:transcription initiation factor TFIID TATA-box-binding protein
MTIDLDMISAKHQGFCAYDAETFPGLVYKLREPKVALLIFVSGKIVLTGAKKRKDIEEAFGKIMYVLKDA